MRLDRVLQIMVCAISLVLPAVSGYADQRGNDESVDIVRRWAAAFEPARNIELAWDLERPTVRMDGRTVDRTRTDLFIRVRWPDAMDLQTGRYRGPTDPPGKREDPFTTRFVFAPDGRMFEFNSQGRFKNVQVRRTSARLIDGRVAFRDGAPLLAGKWVHEVGLPQDLSVIESDGDTVTVKIATHRVRLILARPAGETTHALVGIDDLDERGRTRFQDRFSDFRSVEGIGAPVGFRRTVLLPSEVSEEQEDRPELPSTREDVLLQARVVEPLDDSQFVPSTAGFNTLDPSSPQRRPAAPILPASSPQSDGPPARQPTIRPEGETPASPPSEPSPRPTEASATSSPSISVPALLLGGALGAACVAGLVVWRRGRL